MKKKLLFWISLSMQHFGLAKGLQEKLDDDFFAIIDTPNNPKKMFLNQKIVNFEKTWFFHDQIKKLHKNPDFEYLVNFEKKYGIDLWKIAINERHFYKYNRFYKFSTDEILRILEQECKFFENVLDEIKPDYFFIDEPPFHHQKLLLELCKSKGIKVLCLCVARYQNKSMIVENNDTFDLPSNLDQIELKELKNDEENDFNQLNKNWLIDRKNTYWDKLKALIDYIFISDSNNTSTNYTYYGRSKLSVLVKTLSLDFKRFKRAKFLENNATKNVNLKTPFVYFPLGINDDVNLLHYAPFFTDQIEVIRHIAKSLPIEYKLYVKDHIHAVFRGWKDIRDYQEIMDIPNVTLIHPSYSSKELIRNCNLVATVRGSTSIEAAYENKPSIIFADMPHEILPSVYKIKSITELPQIIKNALNEPVDPIYFKKYLQLIREKSINFNSIGYEKLRNNQFYSGNILSDVDYSEDKVKDFFNKYKEIFDELTNEHLKKIQ